MRWKRELGDREDRVVCGKCRGEIKWAGGPSMLVEIAVFVDKIFS